jgi:hypothetical protein
LHFIYAEWVSIQRPQSRYTPHVHAAHVLAALLLLAACQPIISPLPDDQASVVAALDIAPGAKSYDIVAERSSLRVLVYRAGSLATLGHNHVVSSGIFQGTVYVAEPLSSTTFELRLPVAGFVIDDPQQRAAAGPDFSAPVDADAIEGTRSNLLGDKQLDVINWPEIVLRCRGATRVAEGWVLDVDITTRGNTRRVEIPAQITTNDDEIKASGVFSVRQSALGLVPFSVMMGALKVRDQLDIHFQLTAQKSPRS